VTDSVEIQGIRYQLVHALVPAVKGDVNGLLQSHREVLYLLPFSGKLVITADDLVLDPEQDEELHDLLVALTRYRYLSDDPVSIYEAWLVNLRAIARQLEEEWINRWRERLYPAILPEELMGTHAERLALIGMLAYRDGLDDITAAQADTLHHQMPHLPGSWTTVMSQGSELIPSRAPSSASSST
jgi:hypothetical protein